LAPMLINDGRIKQYIVGMVLLVGVFQVYQCSRRPPDMPDPNGGPPTEQRINEGGAGASAQQPIDEFRPRALQGKGRGPMGPPPGGEGHPFDAHAILAFIITIMMLGANLGIKFYFDSLEERQRTARLKEQNLKQELEYLRYQMNPHFFMNTLNNIHALVDIDPNQAKDSIVDLSKMMRYLLYEADKDFVPLKSGGIFLRKYVELMRLRYTDKVTINLTQPDDSQVSNVVVPPLLFIPFVENAFKHGVSYTKPSKIDISTQVRDGRAIFTCSNTKNGVQYDYGGVGIANVRKRLDIIFGDDYTLDITDNDDSFDVTLNIPTRLDSNNNTNNHTNPKK